MSKSELIKGPWFRIAPNDAGATVTVGDPKGVTVSVDVDEGGLAFLLPIVEAWLKATDEDPFEEDWAWDAKAGVCRPANPVKLAEERERLAERGIEILHEGPWYRLYREGGVPKLGIRTGLKDASKVDLTEDQFSGIRKAIDETLPSEPEYGGSLTIPLIERAILDNMPPGWEPEDNHPIKKFCGDRPWARRGLRRINVKQMDKISETIDGWSEEIFTAINDHEEPSAASDRGGEPLDIRLEGSVTESSPRLYKLNDPLCHWYELGDGRYKLQVTNFNGGRMALTVSGPPGTKADEAHIGTNLKSAGFDRVRAIGQWVWMREDPDLRQVKKKKRKAKVQESKFDEVGTSKKTDWEYFKSAFGKVKDIRIPLSEIAFGTTGICTWPDGGWYVNAGSKAKKSETCRYCVPPAQGDGSGAGGPVEGRAEWRHSLCRYIEDISGTAPDFEPLGDWGDAWTLSRHIIRNTSSPDEILGLVKVAANLYADTLLDFDKSGSGKTIKAIRYYHVVTFLDLIETVVGGQASRRQWKSLDDASDEVADLAFRVMAASLYEKRCRERGIPPEYVSRKPMPSSPDTAPDDPFAPFGQERSDLDVGAMNGLIERAKEAEREVADIVRTLGAALNERRASGGNAETFNELLRMNASLWAEAVEAAKEAFAESKLLGQSKKYGLGSEKEISGKATADLRFAWDCLWIWFEATQRWPVSTEGKGGFIEFMTLVLDAVSESEVLDVLLKDETKAKKSSLYDTLMNATKKAIGGFLLQEQWRLSPPHVQVANPVLARGGRFIAYGGSGVGPAGWYTRFRATSSTNLGKLADPDIILKKALESHLNSFGADAKEEEEA